MKFAAAAILATVVAAAGPFRGRGYGRRHPSLSRGYGYGTKSLGGRGQILPLQKGLRPISRGLSYGGRSDLSSLGKLDRGLGLRELDGLSGLSGRGGLKGLSVKRGVKGSLSPLSRSRSPLPLQRGLVGDPRILGRKSLGLSKSRSPLKRGPASLSLSRSRSPLGLQRGIVGDPRVLGRDPRILQHDPRILGRKGLSRKGLGIRQQSIPLVKQGPIPRRGLSKRGPIQMKRSRSLSLGVPNHPAGT